MQFSHSVRLGVKEGGYNCRCCNKIIISHGDNGPPEDTTDRVVQQWQRLHMSHKFMHYPWLWFLPVNRRIPDILHILLRLTEAVYEMTIQSLIGANANQQASIIIPLILTPTQHMTILPLLSSVDLRLIMLFDVHHVILAVTQTPQMAP